MNQSTTKKSTNSTQAVITPEHQFILAKKFNEFSDIICPFVQLDGEYYTNFSIPINQLHRIQTLYEMITTGIARFSVFEDTILFDCCKKLPANMFGNIEEGYIHYISTLEKNKDTDQNDIVVEPKLVFNTSIETEEMQITFDQKIRFKSNYLKAFPSILKNGFIFSTVDQQTCRLYISIMNPSKNFVGECSKYEVNNLIQYILPLWSIFDINISKTIQIFLRNDFLPDNLKKINQPIMIAACYNLSEPEKITIKLVGTNVDVNI